MVFRLVWYWSGVFCSVCADCTDDPAPVLVLALRRVADVAAFSPIPQFSR